MDNTSDTITELFEKCLLDLISGKNKILLSKPYKKMIDDRDKEMIYELDKIIESIWAYLQVTNTK